MKRFHYKDNTFDITFLLDVAEAKRLSEAVSAEARRCTSSWRARDARIWRNPAFTSNCCKVLTFKRLNPTNDYIMVPDRDRHTLYYPGQGIGGRYCSIRPLFDDAHSYSEIRAYLSFSNGLEDRAEFIHRNVARYGFSIPIDYILEHCSARPKDIIVKTCVTLKQ